MDTDYLIIGAGIAILAFLWNLHRDLRAVDGRISDLSARVSRLEGLLEGLRSAIEGRRAE